jgi:hypothetical protein
VLITAPVHLRALAEMVQLMPRCRVVSATAPLAELASGANRCGAYCSVYGCTETGMVATRRTVEPDVDGDARCANNGGSCTRWPCSPAGLRID